MFNNLAEVAVQVLERLLNAIYSCQQHYKTQLVGNVVLSTGSKIILVVFRYSRLARLNIRDLQQGINQCTSLRTNMLGLAFTKVQV